MKDTTLVLGASLKEERYSNKAIKRLVNKGYKVKAIGVREGEVSGIQIETEKEVVNSVDTVTMYLSAKHQPDYYNYILQLEPGRVIFNPGTENPELIALLKNNNIHVELACTLVLLTTEQY
ncbi:CoA-binding protein [Tenacibaculum sp. 190524A02b]|uniref:CoA-binding protein n=1 Tax=Tenacibaculum vairaonense TaxID=3137860 RepID=A0ABM9PHZ8_9FLAO